MTIKFHLKDAGRGSLVRAITDMLEQETIYNGIPAFTHAVGGYIVKCRAKQKTMKGANAVNIRFSVNSAGRKALVMAIGEITGQEVFYKGAPTFNYTVGDYIIDRDGILHYPDDVPNQDIICLVKALKERGYESEYDETLESDAYDNHRMTIDMPLEGFTDKAIENLGEIVASKNRLIKKALGADSLRIDTTDDILRFPWFTLTGENGEVDAYTRFVCALCDMAKNLTRVTAKEQDTGNDKLTMRLFLIRLGFVGAEYKTARKILLRNLTGNSAYKSGHKPDNSLKAPTESQITRQMAKNTEV